MSKKDKLININEWLLIIAAIISLFKGEAWLAITFLILSDTVAIRAEIKKMSKEKDNIK